MKLFSPRARISVVISLIAIMLAVAMAGSGLRLRSEKIVSAQSRPGRQTASVKPARQNAAPARLGESFGRLPLRFEANQGQTDARVRYLARGSGYGLFLTDNEAVVRLRGSECGTRNALTAGPASGADNPQSAICNPQSVVRMKLVNASPQPRVTGLDDLGSRSHYLIGSDAKQWRTGVRNFARVKYEAVWPGIDLVWYGNQQQLEHDFVVAPGADPRRIRLAFSGAQSMEVDGQGALLLKTEGGTLRLLRPVAWQEVGGQRREVACSYRLAANNQLELKIGNYDRHRRLVIDPVLIWSTYFGGTGQESGTAIAVDSNGSAYVTGTTASTDFPTISPLQSSLASPQLTDAFVLKLSPNGQQVVYSTYLGGRSTDTPRSISVDDAGNAYVSGDTSSDNFPVTPGVVQSTLKGVIDGFVAKLNPAGSALIFSTYLGGNGSDFAGGMAIDSAGSVYLSGQSDSTDLPATGIQPAKVGSAAYRSTNAGGLWTATGAGLSGGQVNWLTIDPGNQNTIYAATNSGGFKSTDGGSNWTKLGVIGSDPSFQLTYVIAVDPGNPTTLYAGTFNGFWKSTNGGASWESKNSGITFNGPGFVYTAQIDPASPATLYAGTEAGVFKTTNGGESWAAVNNGLVSPFGGSTRITIRRLVIDRNNPATVYAGTNRGVYKTTDGGSNWNPANTGLPNISGFPGGGPDTRVLVADPLSPATLYLATPPFGGGTVFKSVDGGANWALSESGLSITFNGNTVPVQVNALAVSTASSSTVYAATSSGIYKSTDGGANWAQSNSGLNDLAITALAVDRTPAANVYAGTVISSDAFAAKLNAAGSAISWLTYLGGSGSDSANGIAVDKSGNAYVVGSTGSPNFPTATPFQASGGGGTDVFVTKINPAGSALVWSSYLGGTLTDVGLEIAVNNAGEAYLTGYTNSGNFPTLSPIQASFGGGTNTAFFDAFVTKLKADGSGLAWSTYLGGQRDDRGNGLALDSAGNAYITGTTSSPDFPVRDAVQDKLNKDQTPQSLTDAFVTRINSDGSALVYSTYLGGISTDAANGIAVDSNGNAYVTGNTSSNDFPTVKAVQPTIAAGTFGVVDAFVTKLGVEADLAIASGGSRNPVMVNNNLTLTLTATNRGPSPATGVTVTHQVPAGANFVSAAASQGACTNSGGTITCGLGNLAANASATVSIVVTPTATGQLSLTGRVSGTETDGDPSNNQTTLATTVSSLPSIAGRVTGADGKGVAGVTVTLGGASSATAQTDGNGFYQFANLALGASYTVTAAKDNFSFEPPSRSFSSISGDQTGDFAATVCSYAISPAQQGFDKAGGSGAVAVTATARCPWTAQVVTGSEWITITSGASGSGNGTVNFTVAPTTVPRSGRLTVAGQTFVVWQSASPCDSPRFGTSSYLVSGRPAQIVTADFNGDGKPDLAALQNLQSLSNPLTILSGDGRGGFSVSAVLDASGLARAMTTGDFNGDGKTDIAVANVVPSYVQFFMNNGAGGFNAPIQISTVPNPNDRSDPFRLYSADLNRDGKTDLIVVNSTVVNYPYEISVLLNSGGGNFSAPLQISLGGSSSVIGVADVNNDGNPDLVTSRGSFSQEIRVFPGDGVGSFRPPVTSALTGVPLSSALSDFNGDGNTDLALLLSIPDGGTSYSTSLALLLGDGTGRFGSQVTYNSETIKQSFVLLAQDYNNDAKPDVALSSPGKVSLLPGDGTGKLGTALDIPVTSASDFTGTLVAGDFNGDARTDLATVSYNGSSVIVFGNRCSAGQYISGRVFDTSAPFGLGGVTVKLSGSQTASTQTDGGGNYEFVGLAPGGNYTVTAERGGFDFTPASQSFNNLTSDQTLNFIANRRIVSVSAASYSGQVIAPESIIAVFGVEMTTDTAVASTQPLPTQLGGTFASVKDSAGAERPVRLFFVSPNQVNLLVPPGVASGTATLTITQGFGSGRVSTGTFQVASVSPGLFAADASGQGLAAALALRIKADGTQLYEPVAQYDAGQKKFNAVPIDLGAASDQVFLVLFGTGVRNRSALSAVTAKIGGADAEVLYAGEQGGFSGLDQINLRIPRSLTGRGEVDVALTVDGKTANAVKVSIK
ncbi:MAG TPA: SBBP repeat-containing protein [Blastocatellia bacterium]|nr:SBBP repeat-containing protein [Blastocatellia bacterium]